VVNEYTTEELLLLADIIKENRIAFNHKNTLGRPSSILWDIIVGARDKPDIVKNLIYQNCNPDTIKFLYGESIEEMPIHMGHAIPDIAYIATWRPLISK